MRVHILNDCKRPGKVTNTDKSPADKEEGAGRGGTHIFAVTGASRSYEAAAGSIFRHHELENLAAA